MFKVLVITYYYPPLGLSGVQRTLKFTEYMKNYNWEPTVLTTRKVGYYAHDQSLLKEAEEAGIRIIRTEGNDPNALLYRFGTIKLPREKVRKTLNRISQTFFIPDNKISWARKAMKKAEKILSKEKFDLIFVSCPPFSVFVKACELKKKFNIPLVVDYRDLWFESYFSFYPTFLHRYFNKRLEYNSLKTSDKIIVTNRKIKEKLLNNFKFLTFEDVTIIPHGFDLKDFDAVLSNPKTNDKMIIGYSGIFLEYNTPRYFLKAYKQLVIERPDIASKIELHFIGHLRKENRRFARRLNIQEYIKDFGYMEHRVSIQKLLSCDVLWFMVGEKKNIDAILPGKIHEYMGTRKPIIGCVPDGAAKFALEEYGASFITKPYDIEEIKNTIYRVYQLFKEKNLPKPTEETVNKYRRDYLTEMLTKQFQFLVRS